MDEIKAPLFRDERQRRVIDVLHVIAHTPPLFRLANARELGVGTDEYLEARRELELRGFVSCAGEVTMEGRRYLRD